MENRQPQQPDRPRLECVGSFVAYEPEGLAHTIEIWTRFESVHDRQRRRVETGLVVLTTTEGRSVERLEQGEYCLKDHPEIRFSTSDPNAP